MIAHCLFEQSGTFKNEFKKLGVEAYDYDIRNDYGETDFVIDLFSQILGGYEGEPSIFDNVTQDDLMIAFFPCTRFEAKIPLMFRGDLYQMKNYSDKQKLETSIRLHDELNRNYKLISELVLICLERGLKLVIENPATAPHYLTQYWCLKPKIVDKNRMDNGDYMKKPTQYWFINFDPKQNVVMEPLDCVEQRRCSYITKRTTGRDRQTVRSEIHPQYASRFIRQYLLDVEGGIWNAKE